MISAQTSIHVSSLNDANQNDNLALDAVLEQQDEVEDHPDDILFVNDHFWASKTTCFRRWTTEV